MSIIGRYAALVKFEHTLFALPFAIISLLVAGAGRPSLQILLWVLVAMVGARSSAMAFNRLVDRCYDAHNPRTADRHLPTGTISVQGVALFTVGVAILFLFAAFQLNSLCFSLAPAALVVILGYSYTKRFTVASHLILGLSLAIAPVGAWLAVTGRFDPFPLWTAVGVLFWVAGFDTIYGCQDLEFDRQAGLRSLAVLFGVPTALRLSRFFHLLAVICLAVAFSGSAFLGLASLLGVAAMAVMLVYEQFLVRGGDLRRIDQAFFTVNSWIGMVLMACVLVDLYLF